MLLSKFGNSYLESKKQGSESKLMIKTTKNVANFCKTCYNVKKEKGVIMAKKRMGISLSEEVAEMLEKQAKEAGLNKSALITTLIVKENKNQDRKA